MTKFWVGLSILIIGSMQVHGYAFKLTAHYNAATAGSNGVWQVQQELSIAVSARDDQWLIQTDYGKGILDYYGCNGTNVFRVLYDPTGPTNTLPGIALEDDYPADANPCVTLPWLAFCSSKRLDKNIPTPAPWALARETPLAYLYRWDIQRLPNPPRLPSQIKFMTDVEKEKTAAKSKYLNREKLDTQAKYLRAMDYVLLGDRDRVGGEYTVLLTTNWSGIEIPTHVQLVFLDHLGQNKKAKGKPKIKYEIEVTSISTLPETSELLPPIDKPVDVVDHRLQDDAVPLDYAAYRVKDAWPITITPEMQQALQQRRDREASMLRIVQRAGFQRPLFVILTVLILISPLLIMAVVKLRNKNKQQKGAIA